MKRNKAFTLIELLVVILILGILLAIAIPAYLSSVRDGRTRTAADNAKAIATAIQSVYVKNGGATYVGLDLANATVLSDLGGVIPANPCETNTAGTAGDWTLTLTATKATIATKNTAGKCDAVADVTLGGP